MTPLGLGCQTSDDVGEIVDVEDGRPAVVETRWTDRTELFVEYPVLVEGETSRFAIHFTELDTFEPVTMGRSAVHLTGAAGTDEFSVDEPGRPGIFGIDVTPSRAGRQRLMLHLETPTVTDRHDLGEVLVLSGEEAARRRSPAPLTRTASRSSRSSNGRSTSHGARRAS